MHTEVALDESAETAEKRALLAQLVAERWAELRASTGRPPSRCDVAIVRHLSQAARFARECADTERERCREAVA